MNSQALPLGPLMVDVEGLQLNDDDRRRLRHPLVGAVILFSRNYQDPQQLEALCADIHGLRSPPLPIAVDHEGGRVQRFRAGFTELPAMATLGARWNEDRSDAMTQARAIGKTLASELVARGVDFSFAPVLDLDWGRSGVIGARSFHRDPAAVIDLAGSLIAGMAEAGMACCGKHFPGHGWAEADSHVAIPTDERTLDEITTDMAPYRALKLDGVMPAHVIYPSVDSQPAGFSSKWLAMLRQMGFEGIIFSDDLTMEGASVAGDIVARANAAWNAGCDMLLVCNAPAEADKLLANWNPVGRPVRSDRLAALAHRAGPRGR